MSSEKLILFCGPSGSGKTTIVHHLLKTFPELAFSVSATTREMRANELEGKDYYFLTPDQFRQKISNNEFVEWEEVYTDVYYGTLKSEIDRIWKQNKAVVFDVDVEGGLNIKKQYGDKLLTVFVEPPSIDELHKRIHARGTESAESLKKRVEKAELEMTYANKFDEVIINDKLDAAIAEAEELVKEIFTVMKIGLFFGSFNPVHVGHLIIADYMAEFSDLEEVWFIVSPLNPLKPIASLADENSRLEMTKLAVGDHPKLKVSDVEFHLSRPSFTINTVRHLQEKHKDEFVIIIGEDTILTIDQWKDHEQLLRDYKFYVYPRSIVNRPIIRYRNVKLVSAPQLEISATFIRNSIKQKKDVRYMLTDKVWNYISERKLYQ